jgi:hypothetical protein
MIAKCGPRILHHWAHAGRRDCDPWWENETPWHREWKSLFPENCREVGHVAADGEIHRADVKTSTGIVIEFQHSAMGDAERLSREAFYGNLVWVIDATPFRQNFDIYHLLPAPESDVAQDLVWFKATRPMQGAARGLFWRLSDHPSSTKSAKMDGLYRIRGMAEVEDAVNAAYRGHHQYDWIRPRRTWLDATCPVYVDLGDEHLVRLEKYDEYGLPCVFRVSKRKFVHDAMTESSAREIATRFYPLPLQARAT